MPVPDALARRAGGPPSVPSQRTHKSVLGLAVGAITGGGLFVATVVNVLIGADNAPLGLLAHYFRGYSVTWTGAAVGFVWGAAVGFIGGWLLGFVHNFTVAVWMVIAHPKSDGSHTTRFLDHL